MDRRMMDREEFKRLVDYLTNSEGIGYRTDAEELGRGQVMIAEILEWFDARLTALEERGGGWRT